MCVTCLAVDLGPERRGGVEHDFLDRSVRYQRRRPEEEPISVSLRIADGQVVLWVPMHD